MTSGYGYRVDPFTGARKFHHGVDVAAPLGTAVRAPFAAEVAATGCSSSAGNWIALTWEEQGAPVFLVLAHLHTVNAPPGVWVRRGELLGTVGATGRATGPHVHVEVSTPSGSRPPSREIPIFG